jgi:hypothetical protein
MEDETATEIQDLLSRNPQPVSLNQAIESLNANFEVDDGINELELAVEELEMAMRQVNRLNQKLGKRPFETQEFLEDQARPSELDGPWDKVPTMHPAIFGHSYCGPHAPFVWISKTSTVDGEGNLGYPAKPDEIRRFGDKARRIYLRQPPSELQKLFVRAVMDWNHPAKCPWRQEGDEVRSRQDWQREDRNSKAHRQQGMVPMGGGGRNPGQAKRGLGEGLGPHDYRHGCCGEDLREDNWQGHRQGGGGPQRNGPDGYDIEIG